ncbi:unnamed protein product [Orchesella dallaii]|uniref:C2H2-type domain-containing protein n=1 Tax=Orchesella dallaii TaxID=48710 RepID=A0ABP1SAS7_9HEXA
MKRSICLVCLKTFDGGDDLASPDKEIPSSVQLFTRFLKFAENYLELSSVTTQELLLSGGMRKDAFCERCEVSVINPICQVYLELLSAQLRLSSQLEQLGTLLDDSKVSCSDKLRVFNMNLVRNQLGFGIGSLPQLDGFRTSLAQKCHLKRKQALPNVVLSSRDCREQIDTIERNKSSFHQNVEEIKVEVNPLDLVEVEADDNALDLEPNNSSSVRGRSGEEESIEEEAIGTISVGSVIKFETLDDDADVGVIEELPSSGVELEGIPAALLAMTRINGLIYKGHQCPNCSEVLKDEKEYQTHYRYHHIHHQRAGIHPCQFCSRVCDTPSQLKQHVSKVHRHEKEPLRCPHCDASFKINVSLKQHIRALHQPGKFACPHCPTSRVFTTNKYLRAHIKKHHPEFFVARQLSEPDNLNHTSTGRQNDEGETIGRVQVRTVNWKVTLPNVQLNSRCEEAEGRGTLNGESSIQDTLENARVNPIARDATDDNTFILPEDEPNSIERQNNEGGEAITNVPIETVNLNDDDEIEELPSSALTELGVIPAGEEALTCINDRLYNGRRCPKCSKEFRNDKEYQKHYHYHHRTFKCNYCGKKFKKHATGIMHYKRNHRTTGGSHECTFCEKVYDTAYKLATHIRLKHKRKRSQCPHCDASFQYESNLDQHINSVHQPGNFPCPHCPLATPMVFTSFRYLRAHMRRRHPGNCQ